MSTRLAPTKTVLRQLFALSGNNCAFPGCQQHLINEEGNFVGQICHIVGVKGERADPAYSKDQLRAFDNLLLMCYEHHIRTDEESVFTTGKMREIKRKHEAQFSHGSLKVQKENENTIFSEISKQYNRLLSSTIDIQKTVTATAHRVERIESKIMAPQAEGNSNLNTQLEIIINLKNKNQQKTAIELLLEFKAKNWQSAPAEMRYKIISNLANCYFETHQKDKAVNTILELQQIPIENEGSLALLSLAHAYFKNSEEFDFYFNKAIRYNPENLNAWLAYLIIKDDNPDDALKVLPKKVRFTAEVQFNIGEIYWRAGNKSKAINHLKKAASSFTGSDERIAEGKAMVASKLLDELITPFKAVHKNFTEEEIAYLDDCDKIFTEAWGLIKNTELAASRSYILMNRGIVRRIKGKLAKSISDFEKAYELQPNLLTFQSLLWAYSLAGRIDEAWDLINKWEHSPKTDSNKNLETDMLKARLFLLEKKTEDGVEVLAGYLKKGIDSDSEAALEVLIPLLLEADEFAQAEHYSDLLTQHFPENINGYLDKAIIAFKNGNSLKARSYYDEAKKYLSDSSSPEQIFQLASGWINLEKYDEAVVLLDKITSKSTSNNLSRALVYSYIQSGKIPAALALAKKLFDNNPANPFLAEVLINTYYETKQYKEGIRVFRQFFPVVSKHHKSLFVLKGMRLYHALGDKEQIILLYQKMDDLTGLSVYDGYRVVEFLAFAGAIKKAYDVAYLVRSNYYDQVEAHEKYIAFSAQFDAPEIASADSLVAVDSVVEVANESGNHKMIYVISNDQSEDAVTLKPSEPLAQLLLGKKQDETFLSNARAGIGQVQIISRIINKYAFAFQQSMSLLATRFSGQTEFVVFDHNADDPLRDLVEVTQKLSGGRDERRKHLLQLYQEKRLTVGALATVMHKNPIEIWMGIVTSNDIPLYAFSQDEEATLQKVVGEKKKIVIDLTSLLGAFFLGASTNPFQLLEGDKIVAQSTLDEIRNQIQSVEAAREEGMAWVSTENGKPVVQRVSAADIKKQISVLEEILSWCHNHAQVCSPIKLAEIDRQERQKWNKILGESFYETILLAEEKNGVILSDDSLLKLIGEESFNLQSFSTIQLAISFAKSAKWPVDLYENYLTKLSGYNYVYLACSASLLWRMLLQQDWRVKKNILFAIKGFTIMEASEAVVNAVGFMGFLFFNQQTFLIRERLSKRVIEALAKRNDFENLVRPVSIMAAHTFQLLPKQGEQLIQYMESL